jgi:signal transduction histidine kinase
MQFVRKGIEHTKQMEQLKTEYEKAILQSTLEIQEETLRKISIEVHDNIGQILSLVALNLNTLKTAEQNKLTSTSNLLTKAIDDLRSLSKSLNPEKVKQIGLFESVQNDLNVIGGSGTCQVSLQKANDFPDFSPDITIITYRIIQEIINNAIKHANASMLTVKLFLNQNMPCIVVEDNGKGFNTAVKSANGIGLSTMEYRAAMLNAVLSIDSKESKGTKVSLTFYNK